MIISITGDAGSGKSTVAKLLAEKLNMKRYYVGGMRRDLAKKKGMTLAEYNEYGEQHPETDTEVDEWQKELGQKENDFIIEGRTSFLFIPHSIKFYLKVNEKEGARRILQDTHNKYRSNEDGSMRTVEDIIESMRERRESDAKRYKKYYNLENAHNPTHYDHVIDTTGKTVETVIEEMLTKFPSTK